MSNIQKYNSTFPAEYYEVGAVYYFFGRTNKTVRYATQDQINQYATAVDSLYMKPSVNKPSGFDDCMIFAGVVIGKTKENITILFKNGTENSYQYLTKKYGINREIPCDADECLTDYVRSTAQFGGYGIIEDTNPYFRNKENGTISGVTLSSKDSNRPDYDVTGVTLAK